MNAVEVLANSRVFREMNPELLRNMASLWGQRAIPTGLVLWSQGDKSGDLAILATGELQAEMDGETVGKVGPGELVGEAAAFFREPRTATLRATSDCELITLPASGLLTIRKDLPAVYELLLRQALVAMAQRVHAVNQRITQLATGNGVPPTRKERSAWEKVIKALQPTPEAPSVIPVLRSLPILKKASTAEVIGIARHLRPRCLKAGEPLFVEGEEGETMVVVVSGMMEVLRNVKGGKTLPLATVSEGVLLGTGSLILRERRNASCVAATEVWIFEMDRKSWVELKGDPRLRWDECLLSAMRLQLKGAGAQLSALEKGRKLQKQVQQAIKEIVVFKSTRDDEDPWFD